jgi:ABC-type nitrate/sulfonate/bicarbonate transport system substrate-binding protein
MKAGATVLAAILLGLAAAQPAAAQAVTLRFGQVPSTVRAVTSVYLYVAEHEGFLAREGIRLAFIPIEGGTDKMVAALDQGKVDVAHTATPYLIQAALAGSDTVAIAGEVANPVYSLIVRPEIANYADLKGKQLGLSLAVDTISISMRKLLMKNGLGSADYRVKELVGTPVRFECLKSGECAGVPMGQPNDLEAIAQGYRRLGDSTQAVSAFQFQVIAVRRAFAQAHQDTVVHFVRALADAFRFIRDPANRDEVVKAVAERTGSSAQIARDTIALYFEPEKGVLPRQAEIDLKGLDQVIAFMGEGELLKAPLPAATRFVDLQYLRAAGVAE